MTVVTGCAHVDLPSENALKPITDWVLNLPEWGIKAEAVIADATKFVELVEDTKPDGSWAIVLDLDETVIN